MICAPGLVFGGTVGVGSRFHVLRARTRFRRYRRRRVPLSCFRSRTRRCGGRRVPYICFTHPYSFSAVPTASGLVFKFCAPGHLFGGTECVGSRFHVLHYGTRFRRYRVRRVSFSCFALHKTPELIFDGTEVVGSRFHVLRPRTRFRRFRGRRVQF
jgi:hypothetical protein